MSVYLDMAHDAGERGEAAKQLAQAIEADHRATFEEESMTDKLSERIRTQFQEKEWPGGIMLEWADEVDALEQRVEGLEDYKREVEKVAEVMYQFTLRRLAEEKA